MQKTKEVPPSPLFNLGMVPEHVRLFPEVENKTRAQKRIAKRTGRKNWGIPGYLR